MWQLCVEPLLLKLEALARAAPPGIAVHVVTYADDINFAVRGPERQRQAIVDIANELLRLVDEWSHDTGIVIGSLDSLWIHGRAGAGRRPNVAATTNLKCGAHDVPPGTAPLRLLGLWLDECFSFAHHWAVREAAARRGLATVWALSPAAPADMVRIAYRSLVLETALYAAEAFFPYCALDVRARLERLHAEGCRAIVRAVQSSSIVAVLYEAGFPTVDQLVRERLIVLAETLKREEGGPAPTADMFGIPALRAMSLPRHRLRNPLVLSNIPDLLSPYPALPHARRYFNNRPLLNALSFFVPPAAFRSSAPDGLSKAQCTDEQLRDANARRIRELFTGQAARHIYLDGSAAESAACTPGLATGAFAVRLVGARDTDDAAPRWIHEQAVAAGVFSCSYTAECGAFRAALEWLRDTAHAMPADLACVHFITDSQSAVAAMAKGPLRQRCRLTQQLWELIADVLAARPLSMTFNFVFSHVGTAGNERVDELAADSRPLIGDDGSVPIWLNDAARHRKGLSRRAFYIDRVETEIVAPRGGARPGSRGILVPQRPAFPRDNIRQLRLSRRDEQLLYRRRIGVDPDTGDPVRHDAPAAACPVCRQPDALGRGGVSEDHIFRDCGVLHEYADTLFAGLTREMRHFVLWLRPLEALEFLKRFRDAVAAKRTESDESDLETTSDESDLGTESSSDGSFDLDDM
jgi:ribonuclease HI